MIDTGEHIMAWFRNSYRCDRCGAEWQDEWSCMCDDDCRLCGARHMSPHRVDDLTVAIRNVGGGFGVFVSPGSAEHRPDYENVSEFSTFELARAFIESGPNSINERL